MMGTASRPLRRRPAAIVDILRIFNLAFENFLCFFIPTTTPRRDNPTKALRRRPLSRSACPVGIRR